jgi:pyrroloquinoline quinone (PQQ) biosynthesis protein C
MDYLATLDELAVPEPEERFFAGLSGRQDPGLGRWARSYHYFSISQAKLLPLMVKRLAMTDYHSLSEVTQALYEEYGSGKVEAVHSRLFARFCEAVGLRGDRLPIARADVEPEVLHYLDAIEAGYRHADNGITMATYCFLERSAVLSYPMMLRRLGDLGFSASDLIFFSTHVVQEAEHDRGANQIARRLIRSSREQQDFVDQLQRMQRAWSNFWRPFAMREVNIVR